MYLLQVRHPKATQDILKSEQNLKMMSKKRSHLAGGFTFLVLYTFAIQEALEIGSFL